MRRIPRLRRPSGLSPATANGPRTTASPLTAVQCRRCRCRQQPITSISTTTTSTTSFHPPSQSQSRFYSASRQQTQAQAQTPTPTPAPEKDQELQPEPGAASEVVEAPTGDYHLVDVDEGRVEGPYAPPPMRTEAARGEDVYDPTYVPAEKADGLKKVGSLADWWYRPGNWDAAGDFVGFRPRQKVTDPVLIEAAVRRAVVEALALREAGREDDLVAVWPTTLPKEHLQGLLARDIKRAGDGTVALGGDSSAVADGLRWRDEGDVSAGDDGQAAVTEALTPEEVSALSQTWDLSWKSISLADPRIRFAVTKRVFQLTGQLVPDHQLPSITNVQALLRTLKKPPKPATLTEEIQKRHPDLLSLPNVTVATKRVTRGDKEKALGRFKLMQEEFKKRDLPGLGHGYARKGKETKKIWGQL